MISTCSRHYFAVKLGAHCAWRVILREDPDFGFYRREEARGGTKLWHNDCWQNHEQQNHWGGRSIGCDASQRATEGWPGG
jgi:hypothetical protein